MPDDAVLASLLNAVSKAPDDVALRLHVAELLAAAGRTPEALPHVAHALTKDPGNATAIALLQRLGAAMARPAESDRAEFDWALAEEQVRDIPEPDPVEHAGAPVTEDVDRAERPVLRLADVAVVLLGGTSHVGKSTVGRALADALGWRCVSTDQLARHPGRPWTTDRQQVREHYATLTVEQLTAGQLEHYRRIWPLVAELVREALHPDRGGLVLEGSGVWPDRVVELPADRIAAVWLTAPDPLLRDRICRTSRIDERTAAERAAIEKFCGRTVGYQTALVAAVDRLGLTRVEVDDGTAVPDLVDRLRLTDARLT